MHRLAQKEMKAPGVHQNNSESQVSLKLVIEISAYTVVLPSLDISNWASIHEADMIIGERTSFNRPQGDEIPRKAAQVEALIFIPTPEAVTHLARIVRLQIHGHHHVRFGISQAETPFRCVEWEPIVEAKSSTV